MRKIKYPHTEDRVILLEDRRIIEPSEGIITFDLSAIKQDEIFVATRNYIIKKYGNREASENYLRVIIQAIKHFDNFVLLNGIDFFTKDNDQLRNQYERYLDTLKVSRGDDSVKMSENYIHFLLSVPRMLELY